MADAKNTKQPIEDAHGNRVNVGGLTKERAGPNIASVRHPYYPSIANQITPETMAALLSALDQNNYNVDFLTLAEEMEEREWHYRSVLSTRKLAVSGLDIVVEAVTDDARDIEIADFVRKVVTADPMIPLVKHLLDAFAKGYSVCEIMWDRSGSLWMPREYKWRDPRHFIFDIETGAEIKLRDEKDPSFGIPLEPYRFVVHEPILKSGLAMRSGLARLAMTAYMLKAFALKDWLAFIEVFGMPLRLGRYEPHADDTAKAALLRAVASIGIDACAIVPESTNIEFIESGGGKGSNNNKIFNEFVTYIDSQVSKGVLGQTMTTDDGSSKSQAEVHNDVRDDIQKDDAKQLSATVRRDLIKPLVDLNFPGPHEQYPMFRFHIEEPEDLQAFSDAIVPLIDRGLPVEVSAVLDKFKLEEPEEGAPILLPESAISAKAMESLKEDEDDSEGDEAGEMKSDDDKDSDVDDTPAKQEPAEEMSMVGDPGVVQTALFVKSKFTRQEAIDWALSRTLKASKITENENYYRLEQRPASDFLQETFMTLTVFPGVIYIQGKLKPALLRDSIITDLLCRLHHGESLTEAQENFLEATLYQTADDPDSIDRLVEKELDDWEPLIDPIINPILDLARRADSYEAFVGGLDEVAPKMDSTKAMKSLATAMFKARGLGDGTDKP